MMTRDDIERIERYVDGRLAAGEVERLEGLLATSREARALLRSLATLDSGLSELSAGILNRMEPPSETADLPREAVERNPRSRSVMRFWAGAVIAACLLIAAGVFVLRNGGQGRDDGLPGSSAAAIATLVDAVDARWEGDALREGSPIHAQSFSLHSGIVHLQFRDGVEVTIQGPAKFAVRSMGRLELSSGLLTATVPSGAEGFQVDTPMAEVVDLGTVFGIQLDDDGAVEVSVFDGEVEVTPTNHGDTKLVQEGQAVRVTGANEIRASEFDAAAYEKVWPVSSGIVGSTGAFRFAPPWPRRLNLVQSDDEIFVLPEGYAQTLAEPLDVNITLPGEYQVEADLTEGRLPAGTRVKSFLLQFKPIDTREGTPGPPADRPDPREIKRIVGNITFDRPVLGLIVRGDDLRASDGRFSERGGRVPQKGRAIELFGTPRDDVVRLSEDRRTVTLDLAAFGLFHDHVRVIVDQSLAE